MAIRKSPTVGVVPKSTWRTSSVRVEHEHDPDDHEDHLGQEVGDREADVHAGRLLHAHDVERAEQGHHDDAGDDVRRRLAERVPEDAEVMRHEERRDGDRDDVGEHLAPRREEGPELVEGAAGEARRAAGLGEHRRGLGVGGGGGGEDQAGDHEHHRRHAGRVDRHEAEGVVDRAADVAVGGREQRPGSEHALEPAVLGPVLSHQLSNANGPGGCSERDLRCA